MTTSLIESIDSKTVPSAALKCQYLLNEWLSEICLLDFFDSN